MRAMLSYAKDVHINGAIGEAAELFGEYGRQLDSMVAYPDDFAQSFTEMRSEIATLENQAVNNLDYFGSPVGWAPTLSFAANYQAYQNEIDNDIRTLFLTRFIQSSAMRLQDAIGAIEKTLQLTDADISQAIADFNSAQLLLPTLEHELDLNQA